MPHRPSTVLEKRKKLRLQHAKKKAVRKIRECYANDLVFDESILVFCLALNWEAKEKRLFGKRNSEILSLYINVNDELPPLILNSYLPEAEQKKLYTLSIFETWDLKVHAHNKTHEKLKEKPRLERSYYYRQRWIRNLKIKQFVLKRTQKLQDMMPSPKEIKEKKPEENEAYPKKWSVEEALSSALDLEATEMALRNVGNSHPDDVKSY